MFEKEKPKKKCLKKKNELTYFEHLDQPETSQRTGQSKMLQYCRCAGGGCGHIESGTTIVFSPPRVTSWMHCT